MSNDLIDAFLKTVEGADAARKIHEYTVRYETFAEMASEAAQRAVEADNELEAEYEAVKSSEAFRSFETAVYADAYIATRNGIVRHHATNRIVALSAYEFRALVEAHDDEEFEEVAQIIIDRDRQLQAARNRKADRANTQPANPLEDVSKRVRELGGPRGGE